MPFTQDLIQLKDVDIHLMYFRPFTATDYLDQLTEQENERFFTFRHENRRQEFVATRILRHRLFGFQHIHYDEHGAPYIEDEGFISISHAPGVVGLAISKDFKVGLDLEPVQTKALRLRSKFLSEEETRELAIDCETEMTKVWSAKEVLYKLAGRKQIHFKTELLLKKETDAHWKGTILNPTETVHVDLTIFVHHEVIVSVNSKACKYEARRVH